MVACIDGDYTNLKRTDVETAKKYRADSEVRAEYDALEPEFNIIQAMIDARNGMKLSQKDLSDRNKL